MLNRVLLLLFLQVLREVMTADAENGCKSSNVPLGGQYTPQRSCYNLGDSIIFDCSPGYMASETFPNDNRQRICEGDGSWSLDGLIFCDSHEPLRQIRILPEEKEKLNSVNEAVDGEINTCFLTNNQVTFTGNLRHEFEVLALRVYLPYDEEYNFEIFVKSQSSQTSCAWHKDSGRRKHNEWKMFQCPKETIGDKIYVKDWTRRNHRFRLCELQVFVKHEIICKPPTRTITNGRLRFNRTTVLLQCDDNYLPLLKKEGFCEKSGEWNADGLFCERKKDYVLIPVTISVTLIAVLLIGVGIIFLKRRRSSPKTTPIEDCSKVKSFKSSRSIYVEEQTVSTPSETVVKRNHATTESEYLEHEYASVRYSGFLGKVLLPIRTRESDSD